MRRLAPSRPAPHTGPPSAPTTDQLRRERYLAESETPASRAAAEALTARPSPSPTRPSRQRIQLFCWSCVRVQDLTRHREARLVVSDTECCMSLRGTSRSCGASTARVSTRCHGCGQATCERAPLIREEVLAAASRQLRVTRGHHFGLRDRQARTVIARGRSAVTDSNRVDGQVAIVTGGSRGIGRATALALAERGADVAVLSRTVAASETVAEQVRARGRRALAGGGDVADWRTVQRLINEVREGLGPIDILINNAGTGGSHGYIWDLDPDVFHDTLMINVLGPFYFMKAALPHTMERRQGVVVNISSGNVRNPRPGRSMYGATKSGLDYLSRSANAEGAPAGVRVYSFYPGPTDTDMQRHLLNDPNLPAEVRHELQARLTQGRLFRPEQPAAAIAWLASPAGAAWTEPICAWSTPEVLARIEQMPGYTPA